MARLYAKVSSDIRGGLGCRGRDYISISLNYNFDGKNDPAGALRVEAHHKKDHVEMKVMAVRFVKDTPVETPVGTIKFKKGGIDIK